MGGIDVDGSTHDVYVARAGNPNVNLLPKILVFDGADGHVKCELDGTGEPGGEFDFGLGSTVAIDQANGDIYVYDDVERAGTSIIRFGATVGGCPEFLEKLPPASSTLSTFAPQVELAVDSPCLKGPGRTVPCNIGVYDSPNPGNVYVTSGTAVTAGHTFAFAPKEGGAPEIRAQQAAGVGETEAVLRAEVNPNTFATSYHFEYTTESDHEANGYVNATVVPVPDAELDVGGAFVAVSEPVEDLQAGTAYRFRLVATNCGADGADPQSCLTQGEGNPGGEGGDASFSTYAGLPLAPSCANEARRTGPSATLADCRAYELVTPPSTNGRVVTMSMLADGFGTGGFDTTMASPDGESLVFGTKSGALPGIGGGGFQDTFEALRGSGGWESGFTGLTGEQAETPEPGGISPDHRYSFWTVNGPRGSLADPAAERTQYLRLPPGVAPSPHCAVAAEPAGRFEWIGCGSLNTEPQATGRWISPGGGHVIFETRPLVNDAAALRLEPCAPPSGVGAIYDRVPGGLTRCISVPPANASPATKAGFAASSPLFLGASADGAVVAFSVLETIYASLGNAETVEIAGGGASFGGISPGGRIFFLKGGDIFACDTDTGGCAGEEAHQPIQIGSGGKSTLVNVSVDGSHAYFVSEAVLTGNEENEWGARAEAGEENFYAWDGSTPRFITLLDPVDVDEEPGFGGLGLWVSGAMNPHPGSNTGPANDPSRTTPDGTVLVFESRTQLTDYDSDGKREIYRYEAGAAPGKLLSCLSCDPTGAAAVSDARLESAPLTIAQPFPPVNSITHIANVTVDGRKVFFQSADRLVSGDFDGKVDVYEWEAQGEPGCDRESGCLSLVSSGRSSEDDYLYAMTPDGSDVFFMSGDTLVAQDPDKTPSIYDAPEGGGFPPPPELPAECLGEACQPSAVAPDDATPASSNFEGPGNPISVAKKPCPKGKQKVRRGGHVSCSRKHKKQQHRGKSQRRNGNHGGAAR